MSLMYVSRAYEALALAKVLQQSYRSSQLQLPKAGTWLLLAVKE